MSDDRVIWRSLVNHTRKVDPSYNYVDTELEDRYYRVFAWHGQYLGPAQPVPAPGEFIEGTVTNPGHIDSLTLTVVDATRIDASWTAPEDDGNAPIVEYQIHGSLQDDDAATFPALPTMAVTDTVTNMLFVTSETTSYSHTGLSAGQTWRYRVLAVNEDADKEQLVTQMPADAVVRQATTDQEEMPGGAGDADC